MKIYKLFVCVLLLAVSALSVEMDEDQLERLKRSAKVGGIADMEVDNEMGEEITRLRFFSYQNEDDDYIFRARVTVEIEDKEDNLYYAQYARLQSKVNKDYNGEDKWQFDINTSMLDRPKVTAYAVEYGILYNGEFIVLDLQTDDVDTPEEILDRAMERIAKVEARHSYSYENGDEIQQSPWN